jgi:hypothetical protein
MNEGIVEVTRDEIRALAGEVLAALGVEKVEMDEDERETVRKAVEEWKRGKTREMGEGV